MSSKLFFEGLDITEDHIEFLSNNKKEVTVHLQARIKDLTRQLWMIIVSGKDRPWTTDDYIRSYDIQKQLDLCAEIMSEFGETE